MKFVMDEDEEDTEQDWDIDWLRWDWDGSLRRGGSSHEAESRTRLTEDEGLSGMRSLLSERRLRTSLRLHGALLQCHI